jgi:hypothetical protein
VKRDNSVIADVDPSLDLNRPVLEFLGPGAHELDEPLAAAPDRPPVERGVRYPLVIVSDGFRIEQGPGIASFHPCLELLEHPSTISTFSCDIAYS